MLVPRPLMAQTESNPRHNNISIGGASYSLSTSANIVLDSIESLESIDGCSQSAWQGPCVLVVIRKQLASIERLLVRQLSS